MKVNTFKQYPFTVDLWTFTKTTDTNAQPVLTHHFARTINVAITASGFGKMYVFFKAEDKDAVANCQLTNLKDANGFDVRPGGYWSIATCDPIINMWGQVSGFKATTTYLGSDGGV